MEVTERRRKQEFAEEMRRIAEEDYPKAEKIRVILDNLSTHMAAAFYEGSRYRNGQPVEKPGEWDLGKGRFAPDLR